MTYSVSVSREGALWLAEVADVSGGHTFAESLAKLDRYVREVIVLGCDLDEDQAGRLDLMWDFSAVAPVASEAALLAQTRRRLDADRTRLAEQTREVAKRLVEQGWSVRDAAAALGVSPGRISQLTDAA